MSAKVKFLLFGENPTTNLLNAYLNNYGGKESYSGKQDPKDYAMLVVNCSPTVPNPISGADLKKSLNLLQSAIDNNVPILLLEETVDHKKAIESLTHFSTEGANLARFIYPFKDQHQRNLLSFIEQFYPTRAEGKLMAVEVGHNIKDAKPVEINTTGRDKPKAQPSDIVAFVEDITNVLTEIHKKSTIYAVSTPPAGCPYWVYPYKVYYPISIGDYGNNPAATITISGTMEVGVYYDNLSYSTPVQWLWLANGGNFIANMINNSSSKKGWSVGGLKIVGTDLAAQSGYSLYESSPKSINKETTYTSEVSFTVGVEAGTDGITGNASYTESNSVSYSLSDWLITLTGDSSWNFAQQTPYNGEAQSFPSGCVTSSGKAATLPAISTTSLSYETQCVYIVNPPLSITKQLSWAFTAYPCYLYMKETGSCWNGTFYYYEGGIGRNLNYNVSFGLALPTN